MSRGWRRVRKWGVILLAVTVGLLAPTVRPFMPSCTVDGPWFGPDLRLEYRLQVLRGMAVVGGTPVFPWSGLVLILDDRLYFLPWERRTDLTTNVARKSVLGIAHRWVAEGLSRGPVFDYYQLETAPEVPDFQARQRLLCAAMRVVVDPDAPRTGLNPDRE